jgi:CBS domain-containing protein
LLKALLFCEEDFMNKGISMIGGAGLGAGLMFLLDPDRGKRRRALVRDQAIRSARKTRNATEATARDAQHRARGIVSSMKSWVSPTASLNDDALIERVRSKLGMLVRHPRSIEVTVCAGTVTLSGPVLADEVGPLIGIVSRISGVGQVENRLEIHEQAGNVPGLQGGPARRPRGEVFELMQSNWSPTTRFLTGAAGGIAMVYGVRRGTPAGTGMAALGLGLLARGITNREFTGLFDLRDSSARPDRRRDTARGGAPQFRQGSATTRKRLKDVMTPGVEVIHPDAALEDAAHKMKTLNVGVIPVCDGDRLVGMLTDRDIVVRVIAERRDPKRTTVKEAMTSQVTYCFEEDGVQEAGMLMVEKDIRRLVVLNREKRLVGIVSLGDLAVHTNDTQLSGEVLEYVSEPARPTR